MINLLFDILPHVHGGGHSSLGAVEGLAAFLTFLESLTRMDSGQIFAAFFPGVAALNNIHPLIVHFPIALFSVFFLSDTLGCLCKKIEWRRFATFILYIATISAILTVIAGFQAAYAVEHNDATHLIMLRHQFFGISIMVLAILLSLYRYFANPNFIQEKTYLHFASSALLMILLIFGADLGGLMVYQYGVAVKKSPRIITPPPTHTHNHGAHTHHAH